MSDLCEEHAVPLLDKRKVEAFILLMDWDNATIQHACEHRMTIKRQVRS